ncbi:MAG: adenosylcobyric acid synthase [Streptococcaceae bacterium]|jgi:CobQ-like glutamine amidotransferase family enzyme|nr:adenosylcobyric acid synthase [Streptococcaceae bacterium]
MLSAQEENFELNICHLYGNLLNTYGDNGNILMLKYFGQKLGVKVNIKIISIDNDFNEKKYDLIFFGGGQDYEQFVVSLDIQKKQKAIKCYVENNGVFLAICGGYQLLGHYYIEACGRKVTGIGVLDHYTLNQNNSRFIGDIEIVNQETGEHYYGFENHQGRTFLGKGEQALGQVIKGYGNNGEDQTEGAVYKNVYGSYFHGPFLARNVHFAYQLLIKALYNKYKTIRIPLWEEICEEEIYDE